MVLRGLVTTWSFAIPPMSRSPLGESATTEGRIRLPLSVGTTLGTRFLTDATRVLVVPRSIPMMRGFSATGLYFVAESAWRELDFPGADRGLGARGSVRRHHARSDRRRHRAGEGRGDAIDL